MVYTGNKKKKFKASFFRAFTVSLLRVEVFAYLINEFTLFVPIEVSF